MTLLKDIAQHALLIPTVLTKVLQHVLVGFAVNVKMTPNVVLQKGDAIHYLDIYSVQTVLIALIVVTRIPLQCAIYGLVLAQIHVLLSYQVLIVILHSMDVLVALHLVHILAKVVFAHSKDQVVFIRIL